MIVYFHLGAHKTASSLIQHRLKRLRGRVGPHRFAFAENAVAGRSIWGKWCKRAKSSASERQKAIDAFRRDFARLTQTPVDALVISSEGFLGGIPRFCGAGAYPFAKVAMANLASLLETLDVEIDLRPVFYIRRTSRFYESCLSQHLSMGRAKTPEDAFAAIREDKVSWQPVVAAIEAVCGHEIPVRRFETIAEAGPAGFVENFLATLGLGPATMLEREIALGRTAERLPASVRKLGPVAHFLRPNVGLSPRGAEMVERLHPLVSRDEWHAIVRPFIRRHFSAIKDPGATFAMPKDQVARLDTVYESDLIAFASRLCLAYPPPPATPPTFR